MAKTYMYLNNGKKAPVYANTVPQTYSGAYGSMVTEQPAAAAQTQNASLYATAKNKTNDELAEELRKQREAEAKKAAEEAKLRKEKTAAINKSRESEKKLLSQNLTLSKNAAKQTNNNNLRQLYIAYMQGVKGIPQQQASWGAGGEIESLKNRARVAYENNRAEENRSYADMLDEIQQNYNNDLKTLEDKYLRMLLDL